jgi:hypothetical protein
MIIKLNSIKFILKKMYVYFFSKTIIYNNKYHQNRNKTSFGLAIPIVGYHSQFIPELLSLILKSEVLPDEVSISMSSSNITFDNFDYPFKLIITQTKYFQNAAQNRNTAARKLKTDIISFFDADDIPHIKRISYLMHAFDMGANVVVHNFFQSSIRNLDFAVSKIENINLFPNSINSTNTTCQFPVSNSFWHKYACGHISIKRKTFIKFRYNESKLYLRREDAEFASRLVKNNIFISYIENELSLYFKYDK